MLFTPFRLLLCLPALLNLANAAPGLISLPEDTSPNPALVKRTNAKANEYQSSDCSGPINYPHKPGLCSSCVVMDPTSNSVYLASGSIASLMDVGFQAYNGNDCVAGWCTPKVNLGGPDGPSQGSQLQKGGSLQKANGGNPCVNLNTLFQQRINSLHYNVCLNDCAYGATC